jgi:hypothetical protein
MVVLKCLSYGYKMCSSSRRLVPLYDADFASLLKKNEKKLAGSFNFTFHYIDDVLSLNNSTFGHFLDRIYPIELAIKDTTDTDRSAPYLLLRVESDSEGRLRTKHYDKRDTFNFPCELFIYIYQHSNNISIWSTYLSVDMIFQSLCFPVGFP